MPLFYKATSTFQPGEGSTGKKLWFPKITGSSQKSLKDISKLLEKRSTLSSIDILGVLHGLSDLIPELLCEGNTIKIDGLGTFRLHAKVTTCNSEEEVSVHHIREFRLSFKPDNEIKEKLQEAKPKKKAS